MGNNTARHMHMLTLFIANAHTHTGSRRTHAHIISSFFRSDGNSITLMHG